MHPIVHQINSNDVRYEKSLGIRNEVLRKPLNLDIFKEDLSDEENQIHFIIEKEDRIIGTVSLVCEYKKNIGKLRQMATIPEVRGEGYGKLLVYELEKYAKNNGMRTVILHARHYALGFYEKLGYEVCSEPFLEVGIEHQVMQKDLF